MVGGIAAQSEEVGLNSFGTTIKTDFRGVFDPANIEERNVVASECYIPSKRRERYVDSIDRTFRAIVPPSENNTTTIEDTSEPEQIIKKLRQGDKLTNQVMLLVGAAGSGKTTFVDHLRVKALPNDVKRSTRWIHLNMNQAPVSKEEIYNWLRVEIIERIRSVESDIAFDELETLRKIFRTDVETFRKGVGRLYEHDKTKYNEKLAEILTGCVENAHYRAQSYCKYVSSRHSALVVIVLDNCDKRLLEEQLLMFEAAQWLRNEFNAMVFLPLREETYDRNLNLPPLDTALKDLAFRIESPRFDLILRSRVDYAISKLKENPEEKFSYDLPNSMKATYTAADKVSYLNSILKLVFDSNSNIRRLLIGLAGRNMRRAMEIFLEFCSSGHISEDHIVKMVQSKGSYSLPISLVSRVVLRSKKRYYDSDYSYVVNLFSSEIDDDRPSYFSRIAILRFLANVAHVGKGARKDGYTRGRDLLDDLRKIGIDEGVLTREINYLARHFCIVSEDFRMVGLTLDDLITISPAGRTHLYMLGNPHYLAAVSEDTWFRQEAVARSVVDRSYNPRLHFDNRSSLMNAKTAVNFLKSERDTLSQDLDLVFSDSDIGELLAVNSLVKTIKEREGQLAGSWAGLDERYPPGTMAKGVVVNIKQFGIFVRLEDSFTGLLHTSKCNDEDAAKAIGDEIEVRVLDVDVFERKISLTSFDYS
ncbi:S1 RNA-binding domain-containing protein [Phaeobacter sp.]|uniref:S1 RNA-binding domain-containing protein n=1 Tax=Phaeobacter sp. TaxID=1902409 RepID=UPI0025D442B4|nr:S1 RNA-binding domain-containing protein [Phaeobacter sp.]